MQERWDGLQSLLDIDPRDVGCGETWQLIDVYAELVLSGEDPEHRFPGITVHLDHCDPCAEDYRGLLALMRSAADRHSQWPASPGRPRLSRLPTSTRHRRAGPNDDRASTGGSESR